MPDGSEDTSPLVAGPSPVEAEAQSTDKILKTMSIVGLVAWGLYWFSLHGLLMFFMLNSRLAESMFPNYGMWLLTIPIFGWGLTCGAIVAVWLLTRKRGKIDMWVYVALVALIGIMPIELILL